MDLRQALLLNSRSLDHQTILTGARDAGRRDGMIRFIEENIPDREIAAAATAAIRFARTPDEGMRAAMKMFEGRRDIIRADLVRGSGRVGGTGSQGKPAEHRRPSPRTWCASGWGGPMTLGSVDHSAFHKALTQPLKITWDHEKDGPGVTFSQDYTVILVQHDWAALVANVESDDGEIRLPFERTCFELSMGGRRICALIDSADGIPFQLVPLVSTRFGWFHPGAYAIGRGKVEGERLGLAIAEIIYAQVRAIAITLDAQVVTTTVQRAPYALKAARLKRGHLPIYDHHILSLSRREKAEPLPSQGATGRHHRLHFRRGHWRHYATFKTWIRWCLAGDPSLGFADKDYRL